MKRYVKPQLELIDLINSDIICQSTLEVSDDGNNQMLSKEGNEEFGW